MSSNAVIESEVVVWDRSDSLAWLLLCSLETCYLACKVLMPRKVHWVALVHQRLGLVTTVDLEPLVALGQRRLTVLG